MAACGIGLISVTADTVSDMKKFYQAIRRKKHNDYLSVEEKNGLKRAENGCPDSRADSDTKNPSNNQWNGTCAARLTDFLARLGSKIWVERPERSSQRTVAE